MIVNWLHHLGRLSLVAHWLLSVIVWVGVIKLLPSSKLIKLINFKLLNVRLNNAPNFYL